MVAAFNASTFLKKYWKVILTSIVLFWVIFAALMLIEDEVASRLSKMKNDPIDRLQYIIRFATWFLLTPLILFAATRLPLRQSSIPKLIIQHFFIALGIILIEFAIEIPIIRYITIAQRDSAPPVLDYAAMFVFKLNIYLLLYFFIAAMTYLVIYLENLSQSRSLANEVDSKNQQLLVQLSDAKLNLLKMQLDPHFLFNTHHTIISLMMTNENDKAILMLNKLSDMLRLSLHERQQTIPLEKEIQILKLYLEIQQIRFAERLQIEFDLEPVTLQHPVPSFILQPIVENAIQYGIARSSGPGLIRIISKLINDTVQLTIENDGIAIDFKSFKPGIGITNTQERLQQMYPQRSAFLIHNLNEKKVAACITLPAHYDWIR
jgi:hypothetical protein